MKIIAVKKDFVGETPQKVLALAKTGSKCIHFFSADRKLRSASPIAFRSGKLPPSNSVRFKTMPLIALSGLALNTASMTSLAKVSFGDESEAFVSLSIG